jgi:dienelactone hydrolase
MTKQAKTLEYLDGGTLCKGFYYTPEDVNGPLPVVLICPAWDGLVEEVHDKATKLAREGYIAFAVDVLGEGKTMHDRAQLQATLAPFMADRAMLLRRLQAAVCAAKTIPNANLSRIGAIGYCFGGLCALDLARSGNADIKAVVSFHGALLGNDLGDSAIHAHILVLHGHDDPLVPPQIVSDFQQEMTRRQADWQLVSYGHTVHAFTRPGANLPEAGAVYNASADLRSWQAMQTFFAEVL